MNWEKKNPRSTKHGCVIHGSKTECSGERQCEIQGAPDRDAHKLMVCFSVSGFIPKISSALIFSEQLLPVPGFPAQFFSPASRYQSCLDRSHLRPRPSGVGWCSCRCFCLGCLTSFSHLFLLCCLCFTLVFLVLICLVCS